MKSILLAILLLLIQPWALAQNPNFGKELWQTTFNSMEPDSAQLPPPDAPWKPGFWTCGAFSSSTVTAKGVQNFAILCRDGGALSRRIDPQTLAYLDYYKRLDIFKGGIVPKGTLVIADFENQDTTDLPAVLCGGLKKQRTHYCEYPGIPGDPHVNFGWTSRMGEIDLYYLAKGWAATTQPGTQAKKIRDLAGDYVLAELYVYDPKVNDGHASADEQYRAWSIGLNSMRANFPDKKILALVRGDYASPGSSGMLTYAERHRLARFAAGCCDGVWCWGIRDAAVPLMKDIAALAENSTLLFEGEAGWAN